MDDERRQARDEVRTFTIDCTMTESDVTRLVEAFLQGALKS